MKSEQVNWSLVYIEENCIETWTVVVNWWVILWQHKRCDENRYLVKIKCESTIMERLIKMTINTSTRSSSPTTGSVLMGLKSWPGLEQESLLPPSRRSLISSRTILNLSFCTQGCVARKKWLGNISQINGKFNYGAKKKKFYEKKENRCVTAVRLTTNRSDTWRPMYHLAVD